MPQNNYECMVIFDSNRLSRDPSGTPNRLSKSIEELGGEVLVSRLWAEQKLVYPIKGQRKGSYWLTYFRLEGRRVAELERSCRLNDDILRNMVVKIDPRIFDTLVAHAKGEALPAEYPEDEEQAGGEIDGTDGAEEDSREEPSVEDPSVEEPVASDAVHAENN